MKRKYLEKACEEIDASIFSGDVLIDEDTSDREELIQYIRRWARETNAPENEQQQMQTGV